MNPLAIGNVIAVTGNKIDVSIKETFKSMYLTHKGKLYGIGQLGSYVLIESAYEKIVGVISEIRMKEPSINVENNNDLSNIKLAGNEKVMSVNLVGTIIGKKFEPGILSFPLIDDEVALADEESIAILFKTIEKEKHIAIGSFSQNNKIAVLVDINKLLSRHVAIVGSTGSGKSTSIATIIDLFAEKFAKPHIIVFDIHGEYAGSEDLKNKDWINIIESDELIIPYWLLNIDEWRTILDIDPERGANQFKALRTTLIKMREMGIKNLPNPEKYKPNVDIPVFYKIDDFEKTFESEIRSASASSSVVERFKLFKEDVRNCFIINCIPYDDNSKLVDYIELFLCSQIDKKITIIDLSSKPSDLVPLLVSLLSRLFFDFCYWNLERDFPIMMAYEEGHKYLSYGMAKRTVERIAKEGRKYGVSIMVASQRPSELSETILAQCNNFIAHRLTTRADQSIVTAMLSENIEGLTNLLPILGRGEAVIVGDSISLPARVKIKKQLELRNTDCDFASLWETGPDISFSLEYVLENMKLQAYRKREIKIDDGESLSKEM